MPTALAPRPLVRLLPAPATDPPYDDEPPAGGPPGAVAAPPVPAALSAGLSPAPPAGSPAGPPVRTPDGPVPPAAAPAGDTPAWPAPAASAGARTAAARFVHACLEIWNGYRPPGHIGTLCRPSEALAIQQEMRRAVRRLTTVPGQHGRKVSPRVALRRMRVCQPHGGAVEISAVLGTGAAPRAGAAPAATVPQRAWAAAFRLERQDGRWRCTFAQLL